MKKILSKILAILFFILYLISLFIFSYYIFKLNVLPLKYLIIGYIVYAIISIIILILYIKKHKIISYILIVIVSLIVLLLSIYFKNTYNFLKNVQSSKYATITYQVITLKSNNYNKIEDLNNKKIAYLEDNKDDIKNALNQKINYEVITTNEFGILQNNLYNSEIDGICIEDSYLKLIREEVEDFDEKTKSIYSFDLKIKVSNNVSDNVEITKDPFIVYISGIDQYGKVSSVRGRSDVNILVVINPITHHILLVNTPRDYYVQLYGTTGIKDKLTHAGIYGIDKSVKTLEQFYDININNYLRVNFDTVIKVVDVIGGIDIYSDKSFIPHTNKSVSVKKGWNHFDGDAALAYSRERYTYINGDNHRGQNQQQVITAIINKVSKSSVLISKYNDILNTLNGSFQTDIKTEDITAFIKYQLTSMPTWQVESIQVTGFDSRNYTYSMGSNWLLYVMEPNEKSVNNAKEKINNVLSER